MSRAMRWGLIGLALVAAGAGLIVLSLSLAGAIYMALQGHFPSEFTPLLWIRLWVVADHIEPMKSGLIKALVLSLAAILIVIVAAAHVLTGTRGQNIHGAARFATPSEVRRKGLFSREGIIVGRNARTLLRYPGEEFVMLAAPTRTGKGIGVVVPNLLDFEGSVLVVDIKFEHFHLTSGVRKAMGQEVFLFHPFAADAQTHRWNPLDTIRRDPAHRVNDILAIAHVLYPHGKDKDGFWNEQARNLFLGVVLLLMEQAPERVNMATVFAEVAGRGEAPKAYLTRKSTELKPGPFTQICIDALARFCLTSENTLTSILATFNGPLTVFSDPKVALATSASDFNLQDLRKKRMTIYLGIGPAELVQGSLILNLFVSRLIQQNVDRQPSDDPRLCVPCLVILDEFAALGKVEVLAKASAYIASYGLRLLTVVQSQSQLDSLYGEHDARTLRTNHGIHIHFAPRDPLDAKRLSERLGYFQIEEIARSRMVRNSTVASSQWTNIQKRALRLPQELQLMGPDEAILILDGIAPIKAQKAYYYKIPVFLHRLRSVSGYLQSLSRRHFTQDQLQIAACTDLHLKLPSIPLPSAKPPLVSSADETEAQGEVALPKTSETSRQPAWKKWTKKTPKASGTAALTPSASPDLAVAAERDETPAALPQKRKARPRRQKVIEVDPEKLKIISR
jgi:type IV secretion system protein VirD4